MTDCYCGENIKTERCYKCNILICEKCRQLILKEEHCNQRVTCTYQYYCVHCYYYKKHTKLLERIEKNTQTTT